VAVNIWSVSLTLAADRRSLEPERCPVDLLLLCLDLHQLTDFVVNANRDLVANSFRELLSQSFPSVYCTNMSS